MHNPNYQKVLLLMPPYWDPLIPPIGIAIIKRALEKNNFIVKTIDLNVDSQIKKYYEDYFDCLRTIVPESNWGNLYNIGHDVLQNHMLAFVNITTYDEYIALVEDIVYSVFFIHTRKEQLSNLDEIIKNFFSYLKEYIALIVRDFNPGVFGCTVNKTQFPAAFQMFKTAKEINSSILTCMGGGIFADSMVVGSPNYENMLTHTESFIDKIVLGKGEILLLKILNGEYEDSKRVFSKADLNQNDLQKYKSDIPDLSDFDLNYYLYVSATASYSCPFQCSFCTASKYFGEYIKRDVNLVVDDISRLKSTYGKQIFFMTDALLNPVIDDLSRELIKNKLYVYMDSYFRVDQGVNQQNTINWRKGGLYRVRLGVESGSQRVLDIMGKSITIEQTRNTLKNLAIAGIKTTTYWVIGHPEETEEDFQLTLDLLSECKNYIYQAECNPFNYSYYGQISSDKWGSMQMLLYPKRGEKMLSMLQTWILNCEPTRDKTFDRVFRFTQHCKKIGLPNPYSLNEIYKADKRWQGLHRNAVPSLYDIVSNSVNHEEDRENVKLIQFVQTENANVVEFNF